eukprot:g46111.t1
MDGKNLAHPWTARKEIYFEGLPVQHGEVLRGVAELHRVGILRREDVHRGPGRPCHRQAVHPATQRHRPAAADGKELVSHDADILVSQLFAVHPHPCRHRGRC